MERYKQTVRLKRCLVGDARHEVTVRRINNKYHCRVLLDGEINQEAVCANPADIGYTCRSLLRMEDKCGNHSEFAKAARARMYNKLEK
jgi:hypothetical protein